MTVPTNTPGTGMVEAQPCPECNGDGWTIEAVCCYRPTRGGECCGNPEAGQAQCGCCGGSGMIDASLSEHKVK